MAMRIILVACVLDEEGNTLGAYYRDVKLPFVPAAGMKLKLSSSSSMWGTVNGNELDPPMKEIVYNLDDNAMYCLFEINEFLSSKYWTQIMNVKDNYELHQFKHLKTAAAASAAR